VAASATDRLHGRKRMSNLHPRRDHAKGRWPKRPPLQRPFKWLSSPA